MDQNETSGCRRPRGWIVAAALAALSIGIGWPAQAGDQPLPEWVISELAVEARFALAFREALLSGRLDCLASTVTAELCLKAAVEIAKSSDASADLSPMEEAYVKPVLARWSSRAADLAAEYVVVRGLLTGNPAVLDLATSAVQASSTNERVLRTGRMLVGLAPVYHAEPAYRDLVTTYLQRVGEPAPYNVLVVASVFFSFHCLEGTLPQDLAALGSYPDVLPPVNFMYWYENLPNNFATRRVLDAELAARGVYATPNGFVMGPRSCRPALDLARDDSYTRALEDQRRQFERLLERP